MFCPACGSNIGEGARFCSNCGRPLTNAQYDPLRTRLVRPRQGRMIAGVCAGFALRYGWDVGLVRVVLALVVVCGAGTPLLAYVIAWIVMPNEPYLLRQQTMSGTTS